MHKSLPVISYFRAWEHAILFQRDSWYNASDASYYISSERTGGGGETKTQRRKGKSYLVPFTHNFCDDDPPLSPKFTLTPKNCSQAKGRASAPLKSLAVQFGCFDQV